MKADKFSLLLIIQSITLILVVVMFVDMFSKETTFNSAATPGYQSAEKYESSEAVEITSQNNFVTGDEAAKNFLMVFSRYNCGYCKYFYKNAYDSLNTACIASGNLKVIFKDFVTPSDPTGMLMAKVAEVGRQKNRFLEVHELLLNAPDGADSLSIMKLALQAGISEADLKSGLNSAQTLEKINRDHKEGVMMNIDGTPSFILNGTTYVGYLSAREIISKLSLSSGSDAVCR